MSFRRCASACSSVTPCGVVAGLRRPRKLSTKALLPRPKFHGEKDLLRPGQWAGTVCADATPGPSAVSDESTGPVTEGERTDRSDALVLLLSDIQQALWGEQAAPPRRLAAHG